MQVPSVRQVPQRLLNGRRLHSHGCWPRLKQLNTKSLSALKLLFRPSASLKLGNWDLRQELGANQTSHSIVQLFVLCQRLLVA